jgi:hypothetical protein
VPDTYKIFFICELISGEKKTSIETSDVGFFEKNNLPSLSLNRVLNRQTEQAFDHMQDMSLSTDFD